MWSIRTGNLKERRKLLKKPIDWSLLKMAVSELEIEPDLVSFYDK